MIRYQIDLTRLQRYHVQFHCNKYDFVVLTYIDMFTSQPRKFAYITKECNDFIKEIIK
jgi:hypothetical protein